MQELLRCQTCSATLDRGKITGFCHRCNLQVCPNCTRMCESCLLNFCMNHLALREVWRDQKLRLMKLCEACSNRWTGQCWDL